MTNEHFCCTQACLSTTAQGRHVHEKQMTQLKFLKIAQSQHYPKFFVKLPLVH